MNILFVNNFRGRGGGEEFLRDLLPGLAAKGVGVGLICRPNTPLATMFQGTNVDVFPMDRSGIAGITSVFSIAKIIRQRRYEIIDIQRGHDIVQSWVTALWAGTKPLLVYTPQIAEFHRSRFLLNRMDRIVTISRHIKKLLIDVYPRVEHKISIIYYGIDPNAYSRSRGYAMYLKQRFGLAADTRIIGAVGDLWKNQIEFLEVLANIIRKVPNIRYALVASETGIDQIQKFKQRASDLGLTDFILWIGRLSKEEMPKYYSSLDIAVNTHRNEGFGIWVLEALASGKPVISLNEGGVRDSLENCPSGVLVNTCDEMAKEIISMLLNPDRLKKMSDEAPRWVYDKFTIGRMVDDYYRYFDRLLQDTRGRS